MEIFLKFVLGVLGVGAAFAWLLAFYYGIKILRRGRRPEHSFFSLLTHGMLWFKKGTFLPHAQRDRDCFVRYSIIFAGILFLLLSISVIFGHL